MAKSKSKSMLDFNGDGAFGMGDVVSLVIGGVAGLVGLFVAGMVGIIDSPDMMVGFITAVIVVLFSGFAQGLGIGGK